MTDRQLVTATEQKIEYSPVLLTPRHTPARTGDNFQVLGSWSHVQWAVQSAAYSKIVAVDFETTGLDYSDGVQIVGVGLAWDQGSAYFHWAPLYGKTKQLIIDLLLTHPGLVAHNVYFDGGMARSVFGKHPNWLACTSALYNMLSNEGWVGQSHGLKSAMVDILRWEDTNEQDLDEWLIVNQYYKGNKRKDNSSEALLESFRAGVLKPDKGQMCHAPAEILGKYCVLDAEACYLLYTEHLAPTLDQFPKFSEFFHKEWMHLIRVHIDQKLHGIEVDREGLATRRQTILDGMATLLQQFRTHPDTRDHIAEYEQFLLQSLIQVEPERLLKKKELPSEPPKFTKDGAISKNWEKWNSNKHKYTEDVISKNWLSWQERYRNALAGNDPVYRFNIQSGVHLGWLLYERLGFEPRVFTEKKLPGTGIKALKHMGEVGKILIEYNWLQKELGYIEDYIKKTQKRSTIHPSFRLPGTKTGRLSSTGPNLQQVPKSKAVMSLFRARPGHVFVDLDFSALEPVVATEFSEDPNMTLIYGDGRPNNDVYLFVGAHIPGMGDKIRKAGYDPYNPTPAGLAAAKKACKHERSICKTVVLACQYGAGVDKVMSTLENDDIFLPREEVQKIHTGYWELFSQVKQMGWDLQRTWRKNGGFVLNGAVERPMCLTEDYKHDVLNRFIQSTGHDILVKYIYILTHNLTAAGIDWKPHVIDWHDAAAVEIPEEQKEDTITVYLKSLAQLNRELGGNITLKGTPSFGTTMADIKEPEE